MIVKPTEGETGTLDSWVNFTGVPWYAHRSEIKSVKFQGEVIASTCRFMFLRCTGLQAIDLSGLNTANVTDMYSMFCNCPGLQSLDLSKFNTAKVENMASMFNGCSGLQSLDLSSFNTANVGGMAAMFADCSGLQTLDLSKFNTANVSEMFSMFYGCSGLQSLDLSSFNTANVSKMYSMFYGCSALESLDLSGFNTANVTDIYSMFEGCSALESLDLSKFNTANVSAMSSMFSDCSGLQSLDLRSFNTTNVTKMDQMFYKCSNLQSLDLSSFNTANVTNMDQMFCECSNLQSLDLSSFNTANVSKMYSMFKNCNVLAELKLSNDFGLRVIEDSNKRDMFKDAGKDAQDGVQIYYVTDPNTKSALRNGTAMLSNVYFVGSALVKDGVPFNMTYEWGTGILAENVVYTRTFTADKPASAMLPFRVAASRISGATFFEFKGVKYENNEWVATMQDVSTIEAYKPYVVITTGAGITFHDGSVSFPQTPDESAMITTDDETGWTFVALNEFKRWETGDPEIGKAYGFAGKNKDYDDYSVAKGEFVKIAAGASAKPGRCYLLKDGPLMAKGMNASAEELPATIKVRFIDNQNGTTGISGLNTETGETSEVQWYDLNGQKIDKPTKRGIYIKNNKKVMVK